MDEKEEHAYVLGSRAVWRRLLDQALTALGRDSPEWNEKRWLDEREDAVAVLRIICGEFGDNDWSDDLYLADVIEKHLGAHLQ